MQTLTFLTFWFYHTKSSLPIAHITDLNSPSMNNMVFWGKSRCFNVEKPVLSYIS